MYIVDEGIQLYMYMLFIKIKIIYDIHTLHMHFHTHKQFGCELGIVRSFKTFIFSFNLLIYEKLKKNTII